MNLLDIEGGELSVNLLTTMNKKLTIISQLFSLIPVTYEP